MYNNKYRCAKCKSENLFGRSNGDLFCRTCNIATDPEEPREAHQLEVAILKVEIIGWKSCREYYDYDYSEIDKELQLDKDLETIASL